MGIMLSSLFLATLATQEPNEAEKLFRAMEQKIVTAKTFSLSCTAKGRVPNGEMSVKVTWTIAQGNKANLECAAGVEKKRHFISNGDSVFQFFDDTYLEAATSPKKFVSTATAQLIDLGSYNGLYM